LKYAGFVGVTPHGHTLRILYEMALGKAEMLGMTAGSKEASAVRLDYDPALRDKLIGKVA
jgi:hypothetical protein